MNCACCKQVVVIYNFKYYRNTRNQMNWAGALYIEVHFWACLFQASKDEIGTYQWYIKRGVLSECNPCINDKVFLKPLMGSVHFRIRSNF